MISFLIKALGGITLAEYNKSLQSTQKAFTEQMSKVMESTQMILSAKIAEAESLKSQLQDYKEDRKFYQDKLFPEPEKQAPQDDRELKPLPFTRIPWTRRKFMLEKQDRSRLEVKTQVDQTERSILEKNRRVSEQENAS